MPEYVNSGLLRIARERKGFPQGEAAERIGVQQGNLSRYETGTAIPSDDFLKKAALVYELPVSFFEQADPVLGAPVSVHAPMWRKKQSVGGKEMGQIIADFNIRVLHIRRMMEAVEFAPQSNIPKLEPEDYDGNIERIASLIRSHWLVPSGPFPNLTASIENAGGIVIHTSLGGSDVSGLTIKEVPGLPPIILINKDQPADRMRFTLAHELGHIVMHKFPNSDMEKQANEFASALLMPIAEMETALFDADLPRLAALKPEWKVSMQALLYRGEERGIIPKSKASYLWRQFNINRIKMREPPELDFEPEIPGVISRMINLHLETFGYSMIEFANILRLHEYQLPQFYDLKNAPEKPAMGLRLRVVK